MEAKCGEILLTSNGKVGIYMSADGAWQKRKIGCGGGNSMTGHNFACGGFSQKIINIVLHSQKCCMQP